MDEPSGVTWPTCDDANDGPCIGVRLADSSKCWAHALDDDLHRALKRLRQTGDIDARGVPVSAELLVHLLAEAPRDPQGVIDLLRADFQLATFLTDLSLTGVKIRTLADFSRATFRHTAAFDKCTFRGLAMFEHTTFDRIATFTGARFHDAAEFDSSAFRDRADLTRARFYGAATFTEAAFHSDLIFTYATADDSLQFQDARFLGPRQLGPMLARKVNLDDATWDHPTRIQLSAAELSCRRTRFLNGAHLQLRWTDVELEQADLSAPSVLNFLPDPEQPEDGAAWIKSRSDRPRLQSLRLANVAGLTVDSIDLETCDFADVHNLDRLRVIRSDFGAVPDGWRWTERQVIAAERRWRATYGRDREAWGERALQEGDGAGVLASEVAGTYRQLRKSSEDQKNEPGAADFYYGEMEMRRHATSRRHRHGGGHWAASAGEHVILTLYWLLAGYGLRAWRALTALALAIATGAVGFTWWGLDAGSGRGQLEEGFRVSAQAATALLRGPPDPLTASGEWLHLALRLVGPILAGLAVLSIRARIKR